MPKLLRSIVVLVVLSSSVGCQTVHQFINDTFSVSAEPPDTEESLTDKFYAAPPDDIKAHRREVAAANQ